MNQRNFRTFFLIFFFYIKSPPEEEDDYLAGGHGVARNEELGEDVVQVPLERLAAEVLAQLLAAADVAVVALRH